MRPISEKSLEKLRKICKENSEKRKNKSYEEIYGVERANIEKEKRRLSHIGKHHSEETRKKISESEKNKFVSQEIKSKISKNRKGKGTGNNNAMRNPETLKKNLLSKYSTPNGFERVIINIVNKYNLPYKYVGDGGFLINGKCPDFVNFKDKKIIEVYYSYFKKIGFGSIEQYKIDRQQKISDYNIIFLDEDDIKLGEEHLLKKIL